LEGLYVANMSGNSVGIGLHGALGQVWEASRRASPVAGFFVGLMVSAVLLDWAKRHRMARRLALVIGLELLLLVVFGWVAGAAVAESDRHFYLLVGLLSVAMGIQNSALLHFQALTVYTTHVTGLLTHLAHAVADGLFRLRDRHRGGVGARAIAHEAWRSRSLRTVAGLGGLWLLYVLGAGVGAACALKWGGAGVWVACAMLAGVIGLELWDPVRI
jgi:uncharacterized membrane protein YoaK (UPF0700 family)